ncbi:MAG: hypothetical protein J3R72DRAFT_518386 [Linnemannia gamsii]|nr:MAG: hypothetical protein J3R72DRAFT_518386 [Linnemannia gamsii]
MVEPQPSLANLPQELQEMVVAHLTHSDTAICTYVSQSWKQLFTPFVWRQIHQKDWQGSSAIAWLAAFLNSCRLGALKAYGHHVQSIKLQDLHMFIDYAPLTLPCLIRAEFADPWSNVKTAGFIGRCTGGLRMLVIHERIDGEGVKFESSSVAALLKHAAALEIVRIESPLCFDSKHIQQLLCSAYNLKTLDLLGEERGLKRVDGYLDANDIVDSEWVCTGLEFFGCRIGNIPRPEITHYIMGKPAKRIVVAGTHQESVELQKKYFDSLSLSLDSGLGLLKDLKELKTVGVPDMEVYIECNKEQAWVKENWPKCDGISSDDYEDYFNGRYQDRQNPFLDSCTCHEHDFDLD